MLNINQITGTVNDFASGLTFVLLCIFGVLSVFGIIFMIVSKNHKNIGAGFLGTGIIFMLAALIPLGFEDDLDVYKGNVAEVERQVENMYNLEITDNTARDMIQIENDDYNQMVAKSTYNENRLYQLYWQKNSDGIVDIYVKSDANDSIYKRIQPYSNTLEDSVEVENVSSDNNVPVETPEQEDLAERALISE